jgi:hypothetical protein
MLKSSASPVHHHVLVVQCASTMMCNSLGMFVSQAGNVLAVHGATMSTLARRPFPSAQPLDGYECRTYVDVVMYESIRTVDDDRYRLSRSVEIGIVIIRHPCLIIFERS